MLNVCANSHFLGACPLVREHIHSVGCDLFNGKLHNWKEFALACLFPTYSSMRTRRVCIWLHKHMEEFENNFILILSTHYFFLQYTEERLVPCLVSLHRYCLIPSGNDHSICNWKSHFFTLCFPITVWNFTCWSTHYLNPFANKLFLQQLYRIQSLWKSQEPCKPVESGGNESEKKLADSQVYLPLVYM